MRTHISNVKRTDKPTCTYIFSHTFTHIYTLLSTHREDPALSYWQYLLHIVSHNLSVTLALLYTLWFSHERLLPEFAVDFVLSFLLLTSWHILSCSLFVFFGCVNKTGPLWANVEGQVRAYVVQWCPIRPCRLLVQWSAWSTWDLECLSWLSSARCKYSNMFF